MFTLESSSRRIMSCGLFMFNNNKDKLQEYLPAGADNKVPIEFKISTKLLFPSRFCHVTPYRRL